VPAIDAMLTIAPAVRGEPSVVRRLDPADHADHVDVEHLAGGAEFLFDHRTEGRVDADVVHQYVESAVPVDGAATAAE